jgi:2-phosphoglycerate kinase
MSVRAAAPVVLIGGANGAGKTWLAGRVAAELDFSHHLGTGFVREVVRAESDRDRDPVLFDYSFAGPDPVATLERQAERLFPAIASCIRRARDEGTSLIIEGTHLIPRLFAGLDGVDHFVVLRTPEDRTTHWSRATGSAHRHRTVSAADFSRIRELDRHLTAEATRYGLPIIDSDTGVGRLAGLLAANGPARGSDLSHRVRRRSRRPVLEPSE